MEQSICSTLQTAFYPLAYGSACHAKRFRNVFLRPASLIQDPCAFAPFFFPVCRYLFFCHISIKLQFSYLCKDQ